MAAHSPQPHAGTSGGAVKKVWEASFHAVFQEALLVHAHSKVHPQLKRLALPMCRNVTIKRFIKVADTMVFS